MHKGTNDPLAQASKSTAPPIPGRDQMVGQAGKRPLDLTKQKSVFLQKTK
jgi:hypothetical protein